ncbi:MAG: tripartite tricarboxylate transporter substrate binding protein [Prevotella sp.]|jgi:tripartite-type tricarboxylate transporter receptor subunit TctC|nr:tripartite tricarboxylate transporter substrate binding protein [Prevotella sp.]
MKRFIVILLAICIAAAAFAKGSTQSSEGKTSSGFPNRQIEILCPGNPGSSTDIGVRVIAPLLEKYLGVPIQIINDSSANGVTVLSRIALTARPDGYTWAYWSASAIASRTLAGELQGRVEPLRDYVIVGGNYRNPHVMIAKKDGPYKKIDDIVNYAKTNPGDVRWGRMGPVSVDTSYIQYLEQKAGIKITPLEGMESLEGMAAIMGSHMDISTDHVSSSLQMWKDGSIDIIGIGGDERRPEYPEILTFREQGYDFPLQTSENYFFGSSKIDKEIVDYFTAALKKAIDDPEYKEICQKFNLDYIYIPPEEATQVVFNETDIWKRIVSNSN